MKLKFKQQRFQEQAAKAVVDCFIGQPYGDIRFTMDRGVVKHDPVQGHSGFPRYSEPKGQRGFLRDGSGTHYAERTSAEFVQPGFKAHIRYCIFIPGVEFGDAVCVHCCGTLDHDQFPRACVLQAIAFRPRQGGVLLLQIQDDAREPAG